MTVAEAAELCAATEEALWRWICRRRLPYVRVRLLDLDDFVESAAFGLFAEEQQSESSRCA